MSFLPDEKQAGVRGYGTGIEGRPFMVERKRSAQEVRYDTLALDGAAIPGPGGYIMSVRRDGEIQWLLRCPRCRLWADIDADQLVGEISVDCPECSYHETHDYRPEWMRFDD